MKMRKSVNNGFLIALIIVILLIYVFPYIYLDPKNIANSIIV